MYLSDDKVRFGLVDEMLLKGRILLCVEKPRLVEVVVFFVNVAFWPFLATSNGLTNFWVVKLEINWLLLWEISEVLDDEDDVLCKNLFSVDNFGRRPKEGAKHGRLASVPDDKSVDVVDSLVLEFGNIFVLVQNPKIQIVILQLAE